MIFKIVWHALHFHIKGWHEFDANLVGLNRLIMESQAPIGSEVTRGVSQIAPLVWMVSKRPMIHQYMNKDKPHEVRWISSNR